MWIAFSDAFISAVEDRNDKNGLVVRARNPEHLRRLFPTTDVVLTPDADYGSRVYVSKEDFSQILVERVDEIRYHNFKASVTDGRLHQMFADMWSIHWAYQQNLSKPDRSRHMAWGPGDVVIRKRNGEGAG